MVCIVYITNLNLIIAIIYSKWNVKKKNSVHSELVDIWTLFEDDVGWKRMLNIAQQRGANLGTQCKMLPLTTVRLL